MVANIGRDDDDDDAPSLLLEAWMMGTVDGDECAVGGDSSVGDCVGAVVDVGDDGIFDGGSDATSIGALLVVVSCPITSVVAVALLLFLGNFQFESSGSSRCGASNTINNSRPTPA